MKPDTVALIVGPTCTLELCYFHQPPSYQNGGIGGSNFAEQINEACKSHPDFPDVRVEINHNPQETQVSRFHFIKTWYPITGICWQEKNRAILNKAISAFNNWQLQGMDPYLLFWPQAEIAYSRTLLSDEMEHGYYEEVFKEMELFLREQGE